MEDELTLMDVFKVLARRWKLIVAVTLIPTIVVAGMLLFIAQTTYTSTAIVMVSDTRPTVTVTNPDQLADPLVNLPMASVVAYQTLAKDPSLSQEVIDKAGLAGEPWNMTVRNLASAVKISSVTNSGLIQIDVTLTDRDKAALAANTLAEGLVARGESISKTSLPAAQQGLKDAYDSAKSALQAVEQELAALYSKRDSAADLTRVRDTAADQFTTYRAEVQTLIPAAQQRLKDAYVSAKSALQAVEQQLAALYSKRDSVSELTSVRDTILGQVNGYRAQVQTLETEIRAQQASLTTKQSTLASTGQYLTTTKSITDDQTLLDVAKATSGQSVLDLAQLNMTSQEINPVWQSLTSDTTSLKTDIAYKTELKVLLEKTIPGLESRVLDLNKRIDAENQAITNMQRRKDVLAAEFDLATANYVSSLKLEDFKAVYEKTLPGLESTVLDLNARIDAENQAITKAERKKSLLAAEFDLASANYVSSLKLEGNPLPPVSVVQQAIPADEKDAGGRSTKVAITLVAALLLGILLAFLIDYIQTARAVETVGRRSKES